MPGSGLSGERVAMAHAAQTPFRIGGVGRPPKTPNGHKIMAYDEGLAHRIRALTAHQPGVDEKKMFGGLAFMKDGHMAVGVRESDLMVRIGKAQYEAALARPHVRKMDFTGRPLAGFVYVAPEGTERDDALEGWIHQAFQFVATLPPR